MNANDPLDFNLDGEDAAEKRGYIIGEREPEQRRLILSPSDPLPSARVFVRERFTEDGVRMLRHYGGVAFAWRGNRYAPVEDAELRAALYHFTESAVRPVQGKEGDVTFVPYQPTSGKISSLIDALAADTHLSVEHVPPVWLTDNPALPHPLELLSCRGGNLHIPTRRWSAPTPKLFTTAALSFDYDANAPTPRRWLEFLNELWPDDPQAIETLQDWFGYCLIGDTSQQKMLLLVGPKRSGKGTIGRVLRELIGVANVAGPTTSSLATQFGLQPLIGKTLAIVSDARFSGQPESAVVLERLLCISGEDTLTIPRKHIGDVTMKLPTRIMFLTNELPRVADTSGALAGRFIVLMLSRSFFGEEDTELTAKLSAELPGILNWAIDGWERLRRRARFVQPESSTDAIEELANLASPVLAFVRDRCIIGPAYQVEAHAIYDAWKGWCTEHGRDHPGTIQTFARDLLTAVPTIRKIRPRDAGDRWRGYAGIGLAGGGGPRGPQWSATPGIAERVEGGPVGTGDAAVTTQAAMGKVADHRGPADHGGGRPAIPDGWTADTWAKRLRTLADACEGANPARAAELRREADAVYTT